MYWAANNHLECCKILFASGANVNVANNDGFTPLFMAAVSGHEACVEWLVNEGGAQLNLVENRNYSALMFAALRGYVNIVKFLKKKGAHPDTAATRTDGRYFTAAKLALEISDMPIRAAMLKVLAKVCFVCGSGAGRITKCGGCLSVYYCLEEHQHEHWPIHKGECAALKMKRERQEMEEAQSRTKEEKED